MATSSSNVPPSCRGTGAQLLHCTLKPLQAAMFDETGWLVHHGLVASADWAALKAGVVSTPGQPGVNSGSTRGQPGVNPGSTRGHPRVDLHVSPAPPSDPIWYSGTRLPAANEHVAVGAPTSSQGLTPVHFSAYPEQRERQRERRVSVYEEAPGFRPGPRQLLLSTF